MDKIEDDGCMEGLQNAAEFCRVAGSHFTGAGITAVQRWRWCGQCITISGISQLLSYYPCPLHLHADPALCHVYCNNINNQH